MRPTATLALRRSGPWHGHTKRHRCGRQSAGSGFRRATCGKRKTRKSERERTWASNSSSRSETSASRRESRMRPWRPSNSRLSVWTRAALTEPLRKRPEKAVLSHPRRPVMPRATAQRARANHTVPESVDAPALAACSAAYSPIAATTSGEASRTVSSSMPLVSRTRTITKSNEIAANAAYPRSCSTRSSSSKPKRWSAGNFSLARF